MTTHAISRPLELASATAEITIPAGGGTVTAIGLSLPSMGLNDEPLNAIGPELTLVVVVEPVNPAGFTAPDPQCVLIQRLYVSQLNQTFAPRTQMSQTPAAASSFCFRFPVPPGAVIEADVSSAATASGNNEQVRVHFKAYVITTDTTPFPQETR